MNMLLFKILRSHVENQLTGRYIMQIEDLSCDSVSKKSPICRIREEPFRKLTDSIILKKKNKKKIKKEKIHYGSIMSFSCLSVRSLFVRQSFHPLHVRLPRGGCSLRMVREHSFILISMHLATSTMGAITPDSRV